MKLYVQLCTIPKKAFHLKIKLGRLYVMNYASSLEWGHYVIWGGTCRIKGNGSDTCAVLKWSSSLLQWHLHELTGQTIRWQTATQFWFTARGWWWWCCRAPHRPDHVHLTHVKVVQKLPKKNRLIIGCHRQQVSGYISVKAGCLQGPCLKAPQSAHIKSPCMDSISITTPHPPPPPLYLTDKTARLKLSFNPPFSSQNASWMAGS